MASEVPISVIRQVQIALREEAGVSSYDPEDPVLLNLPSLDEVIEGFDPSPAYLRCKQCRGKLLRGLQSIVCVYCGAQQRREIPPDPIPYKSTFGYRWLLKSLDLNGSEAVVLPMEGSDSNKGKKVPNEDLILSDLFDLELKWLAGVDENESKPDSNSSLQSKSSLNLSLAGVDLDNFFVETTKEFDSVTNETTAPNIEKSIESHEFPGQESLGLFESAQSSNMAAGSGTTGGAFGDSFSGWQAEFQSTSSKTLAGDSKPRDPFMVQPVDHPIPVESFFGSDTDVKFISSVDNRTENEVPPESVGNSWIQDDQFLKEGTSNKAEKLEMDSKATYDREPKETSNNLPSTSNSWMQDDLWPTGNRETIPDEKLNENDPWQDFTSSGKASDPFPSTWKQTIDRTASPNERASEMNLMGRFDNNVQEMDFGDFVQPDLFSGASPHHNMQENSITNRVRVAEVNPVDDIKSQANSDKSSLQPDSSDAVVDSLMSQMPDLSFMLDSKLSIPEKKDGLDSNL